MALSLKKTELNSLAENLFERNNLPNSSRVDISLAGKRISIFYGSSDLAQLLAPAISHLECSLAEPPELNIFVCDSTTHPVLKWSPDLSTQHQLKLPSSPSHPVVYGKHEQMQFAFQFGPSLLSIDLYDGVDRAVLWLDSCDQYLSNVAESLCYPFRTIFAWFVADNTGCLIHASAIADERGGLVFSGTSGSGKSTCALISSLAGKTFIGDDAVIISCKDTLSLYSPYCVTRVRPDELEHYPTLTASSSIVANSRSSVLPGAGKLTFSMQTLEKSIGSKSADFRALVFPEVVNGLKRSKAVPISPAAALRRLAPSSLLHIPGYGQAALTRLAQISNSVPCYHWQLGVRREEIVELVERVLGDYSD